MALFSQFTHDQKVKITEAIGLAERDTSGEIRVHLSYSARELDVLQWAKKKFKQLKMDETELRNGVLLYVNPKIKKFAIFGDEGIHARVHHGFWEALAVDVSQAIKEKDPVHGIELVVSALGRALKEHFPYESGDKNELSNDLTESD